MATEMSQPLATEWGNATGRIHGVNHIVLFVEDMDESVRFYRDLLGFKVVRTNGFYGPSQDPERPFKVMRTYFFDIGLGTDMLLGMYELKRGAADESLPVEPALATGLWPPSARRVVNPRKADHIAFNVDSREDLVWYQAHLQAHGVTVTEISSRDVEEFGDSIYFYDPSGNPLEIATFDWGNPKWNGRRGPSAQNVWMRDADPVPALRSVEPTPQAD